MDNNILISIIIPTFGEPLYLKQSIESVIGQSMGKWELIIVDDNNPESPARSATESLVAKYLEADSRITYIKHDKNRNGAVARNTGFAVARGKYIALLDSDDEYMPNRLRRCFDEMENVSEDIAGVYTGCEFRRRGKTYNIYKDVSTGKFLKETLACTFMFCTGSNIFVRKSVVDALNGFDPAFLRHQDFEFLVRLFEKYSLIGIPEVLVIKNEENFNLPDIHKQIAIKDQYLDKYKRLISELPQKDQSYIYFWKNVTLAERAMAQNEFKLANHFYNEARQYGSLSYRTWFRRLVFPIFNLIYK